MNTSSDNAARRLLCLPEDRRDAAANMALDLWMLRTAGTDPDAAALFRTYGWSEPAFTFGQSQHWHEVSACAGQSSDGGALPALVRRPTGGGLVDHRSDWTYALAFPARSGPAAARPASLYTRVHRLLAEALESTGVPVRLKDCPPPGECSTMRGSGDPIRFARGGPSVCFDEPVAGDLLDAATGAKVAGAAMKRTRDGVLFQGSVVADALRSPYVRNTLRETFISRLGHSLEAAAVSITPPPDSALASLRETFRSPEWNRRR